MLQSECPDLQLHPDEPIVNSEHDSLNRGKLAESIASRILSRDTESCMVVGISGPWGSGKSSLLNLIRERIDEAAEEKSGILILRFNPWSYSTIDQLIAAFFRELRSKLSLIDRSDLVGKIGTALGRLGALLQPMALIPGLQGAALVSSVVSPIGKVLQDAATSKPLVDIKEDLNGYLQEAGVHLVVLVDDLDRAEPECVRLMLQLIRMNADFSATTYILAFDRERTARALSTSQGGSDEDGRDYLGKLIQVPFDLPVLESLRLKVEVVDAALPLFEMIFEEPDLAKRYQEMIRARFYELFESVRDAKRFANALSVTVPLVWDGVNAVDFAVLEALRLRYPLLHEKLHEHKWLLLNESRGLEEAVEDYLLRDKQPDREGHQETFNALLELAGDSKDAIRAVLEALFPQLSRLRYEHSPWRLPLNPTWSRQRLVCSMDHFDSYFYLAPGMQAISEAELNMALSLAGNRDRAALAQMLVKLDKQAKGTTLMRRLSMCSTDLTPDQVETVIGAFLNVSSDPARWGHPAQDHGPMIQIGAFMQIMVSAVDDADEQFAMIDRCIRTGTGLCGVVRFASAVLDAQQIAEDDAKRQAVSTEACKRLQAAAESGDLLSSPCATSLLYPWLEWDPEQTKAYVRSLVQDGKTLLQLLANLRRTAGRYSDASGYEEPSPQLLAKILNYIVERDVVNEASKTAEAMLKKSSVTEETEILSGFIEGAAALANEKVAEEEQQDV